MSKNIIQIIDFNNLTIFKTSCSNHHMYNIFAKIIKTFEICKQFSENLVNESEKVQPKGAAYLRDSRVVKKNH